MYTQARPLGVKTTSDTCTFEMNDVSGNITAVKCIGTAMNVSEKCLSKTYQACNYHPTDEYRNGFHDNVLQRSHLCPSQLLVFNFTTFQLFNNSEKTSCFLKTDFK